jgi:hypothetical protein
MLTGQQWTDASAISGQNSPVEVLHLSNVTITDVGTWRISLIAPQGVDNTLVSVSPLWEGAVRALATVSPPTAQPGQQVKVTLDVLGPNGPISDPATLSTMIVGVTVTGNGLPGTVGVPVSAVSGAPSEWAGVYTVPRQQTVLTFTGTAAGYGLYATQVSTTVGVVGAQTQGLSAYPEFTGGTSVQAGGTITGHVVLTNQTGSAQQVKLEASASGATATLTSPAGPVTVQSGSPPAVPFTITVARDSPAGPTQVQVQVVDATTGQVLSTLPQNFTVTKPPGFLATWAWEIIGLITLIIASILAAAWWRAIIPRRLDVRGLVAILGSEGEELHTLKAPSKPSLAFRFVIQDAEADTPRLDHAVPGFSTFTVRRARHGEVSVSTPTGERFRVTISGHGQEIGQRGLVLSFRDAHS